MKILIVEDDKTQNKILNDFLTKQKFDVISTFSAEEALKIFVEYPFDIVLSDFRLPNMNGGELLSKIKKINPYTSVIIITAFSTVEGAVNLMKDGAFDYLQKPLDLQELLIKIKQVRQFQELELKRSAIDKDGKLDSFPSYFVGKGNKITSILSLVNRIAQSDVPVLITGESGTGKEMVADMIHYFGPRKNHKMIKVNCSAIPENLLESKLFGHVKGAFTGAFVDRKGRFTEADKGIIFLDEIGEISQLIQVKLLRVLQTMQFEPVGSSKTIKVDVRVVSATNKDLNQEIKNGRFREDLFYRLNVIPVHMPPLRDRKEDIPDLINFFISEISPDLNYKISPEAIVRMVNYPWKGNIRQLKNIVQRLITLSESELITENDLPDDFKFGFDTAKKDHIASRSLADKEKEWILETLIKTGYNQQEAVSILGIHRNTLARKMKDYGIKQNR